MLVSILCSTRIKQRVAVEVRALSTSSSTFVRPQIVQISNNSNRNGYSYGYGFGHEKRSTSTGRTVTTNAGPFRKTNIVMMPEGPEVRTLVDQLKPGVGLRLCDLQFVSGRYTKHGKPKGFENFKKTMTYYKSNDNDNDINNNISIDTVTSWNAKGKFIWLTLDDGLKKEDNDNDNDDYLRSIWITLGMSGRFVSNAFNDARNDDGTTHKQARWYFEFLNENDIEKNLKRIYYYDTRNFGTLRFSLSKKELEDKLDSLGPDILDENYITEEIFLDIMSHQRQTTNICKFLMNQKKIAGVGNYLLSEALYRSNLDPFSSIGEINIDQRKRLYYEVIETASASYKKQGMTRQKGGSYRDMDGNEGKFAFSLQCYGRKICPKGRTVIQDTKGPHGRTIWYVEDQLLLPLSKRFSSNSTITKEIPKSKANVSGQHSKSISVNHNTDNDNSKVLNDDLSGKDLANYLIDESWKQVLAEFLSSEKFERLSNFLSSEHERNIVYPPTRDVFSALNECSFDNVKVVIIGQDPYHGPNQGHGLAFSVQEGVKIPPSLRNIFKELNTDLGMTIPSHGNLSNWSKQGILLLNTVMTVQAGKANSHSKMGWEDFTSEIVEKLNNQKEGLVFLLWGGPAAKKGKGIDEDKHFVIKTSHPSPLGATKTKSPFLGSKCFSKCNDALISVGLDAIDWNIEEYKNVI